MPVRQSNISLLIGMIVSVVLHVTVISPMLAAAMKPTVARVNPESRFEPDHFRRPPEEEEEPPPEEDPLKLGIEDGSPSTMTWVGHKEYEEHLARLAEVEQAAFTDEPAGGVPTPPPTPQTPPPVEAQPVQEALADAEPVEEPLDQPPVETPSLQDEQTEQARDVQTPDELEMLAEEPQIKPFLPAMEEAELTGVSEAEGSVGTADREQPDEEPTPPPSETPTEEKQRESPGIAAMFEALRKLAEQMQAQQPPEPQPPAQPQVQQQPTPPQPPAVNPSESTEEGDQADKQSDATSIVEVPMDQIKIGKPLAARGLELKPARPSLTTLQSLKGVPGNPLVEMRFMRNGRVKAARILETSGDRRMDSAIESSLYRWRAKGKQLRELKGDETIPVRIRIMFGRR